MKDTGLEDKSIDVAVFSLALWGVNWKDYLNEAYRLLNISAASVRTHLTL